MVLQYLLLGGEGWRRGKALVELVETALIIVSLLVEHVEVVVAWDVRQVERWCLVVVIGEVLLMNTCINTLVTKWENLVRLLLHGIVVIPLMLFELVVPLFVMVWVDLRSLGWINNRGVRVTELSIIRAGWVNRLLHQVLKPTWLLQVVGVLCVHYLEKDFLNICLIRLVLNNLAKLDSVDFGRNKSLHFVEEAFLLWQDWLKCCRYLWGYKDLVHIIHLLVLILRVNIVVVVISFVFIEWLELVVVVADLPFKHLNALE